MANLIKLIAPPAFNNSRGYTQGVQLSQSRGLAALVPDANATVSVHTSQYDSGALFDAGFIPAPIVTTTAARPTAGLYPGMQIFDSTLGTPIWRNSANSGWVSASGGAV